MRQSRRSDCVVVDHQDRLPAADPHRRAECRRLDRSMIGWVAVEHRNQRGPGVRGHDGRLLERAVRHAARTRCDRRRLAPPGRRRGRAARTPVPAALVERAARGRQPAGRGAGRPRRARGRPGRRTRRDRRGRRGARVAGRTTRQGSCSSGAARSSACGSPASGSARSPSPHRRRAGAAYSAGAASLLALSARSCSSPARRSSCGRCGRPGSRSSPAVLLVHRP